MRFTLIKRTYEDKLMILDVLKSLLGASLKYDEDDNYLIIYHSHDNVSDITNVLSALGDGLMFSVLGYTSMDLDSNKLALELQIARGLIDDLPYNIYNLKTAILAQNKIKDKRIILDFILDGSGINEQFIKDFVSCDLNVSKASKLLYVHRNTMIYKLDKLKELSDFDLRSFKDAYILYYLIDTK